MIRVDQFIIKSAKGFASKLGLRFGLAMGVFLLMLVVLQQSPGIIRALAPLDVVTARITAAVLQLSGLAVHQEAAVLSHPAGFSYKIYYNCTGFIAAGFLSAGLLVLPGRWSARLVQVFLGTALVLALNLVRLVSLFYIGVRYPQVFGFFHTILWNAGMLVFMLGFWLRALRHTGA
jgi:exosortase/archaeosortase family protein